VDHTSVPAFIKTAFPTLYSTDGMTAPVIDAACAAIETEWPGIFQLYQSKPGHQANLEGYLVGWWLADMYPDKVVGVSGDGGMPLTSKSIGGVSIARKDLEAQPALKQLESNAFGVKALSMIMGAPERYRLYGRTNSLASSPGFFGFPGWGM